MTDRQCRCVFFSLHIIKHLLLVLVQLFMLHLKKKKSYSLHIRQNLVWVCQNAIWTSGKNSYCNKDQGEIWGITEGQQNLKQEKGTDQMGDMCPDLAYVRVQMEASVVLWSAV